MGTVKALARGLATIAVLPRYVVWRLMAWMVGADRALTGATQGLSRMPGFRGRYMRVAFLRLVLDHCDESACVEYGTVFSQCGARIGANVYIGAYCTIGRVHIGDETMLASGIHVPSGGQTHGASRLDIPMRLQPGNLKTVHIGRDCWIGGGAIVMDDVGDQSIVAAGAVVTQPVPARVIAAGVPAKVIRTRCNNEQTS